MFIVYKYIYLHIARLQRLREGDGGPLTLLRARGASLRCHRGGLAGRGGDKAGGEAAELERLAHG